MLKSASLPRRVTQTTVTFVVAYLALVAITAATPVTDGPTTPAPVTTEASLPEAEAASPACGTAGMPTCEFEPDAICIVQVGPFLVTVSPACDWASPGCGPE